MKINTIVLRGTVVAGGKSFSPGDSVLLEKKEAEGLEELGFVEVEQKKKKAAKGTDDEGGDE